MLHLSKESFHSLLVDGKLKNVDKLLIILFWDSEKPKSAATIKAIGTSNGLRECQKWNVSAHLNASGGRATNLTHGWILTAKGREYLKEKKFVSEKKSATKTDEDELRAHLYVITDPLVKSFLDEAITCLEAGQKRAAVVFSWVGAVSVLHNHVLKHHLAGFNAEASRRDAKWKVAKTADDLGLMREHDFLNVLEAISVIGKNVKQRLQESLQLRNGCGHPNTLAIGTKTVSAHIEILILNVFSKF